MPSPDFEPTVPALIARCRERFAEREQIVLGDERARYADTDAESARLARGLLMRGVGKGTRIGLLMGNGPGWAIAWQAAARIGALVIPINTFFRPRELAWVLRHADVHTLLTCPSLLRNDYQDMLEQAVPSLAGQRDSRALACPELPYLRQVVVFGGTPRSWACSGAELSAEGASHTGIDAGFLAAVEAQVVPADPMLVIYSSGSMAEPKGVVHTQGALIRQAWYLDTYKDVAPNEVIWSPMPFFWVGGFVIALVEPMLTGSLVLCQEAFEPGATLALLERERVTCVMGWPQYSQALVDHPDFAKHDLSAITSGSLHALLPEEVRPRDPELRSNSLGMTETCGPHTNDRMDVDLPERLRGTFGRAMPLTTHRIIDPETGETLGPGQHGEICVRGGNLMQGLYKREREDVFEPDGYYRTGDGGHIDEEGHLFFRARLSEMIKTGGANVTPREVEIAIDALEEVQSAYVVGVPHPDRGQNVAAAVILNEGHALSADVLRTRLKSELSAYKVPRHIYFYTRAELPFTDSGKMQKVELTAMLTGRVEAERVPAEEEGR